jgi:hypothetical protein
MQVAYTETVAEMAFAGIPPDSEDTLLIHRTEPGQNIVPSQGRTPTKKAEPTRTPPGDELMKSKLVAPQNENGGLRAAFFCDRLRDEVQKPVHTPREAFVPPAREQTASQRTH